MQIQSEVQTEKQIHTPTSCGQSYKDSMLVNYDSRVVITYKQFTSNYDTRIVI